MKKKISIKPKIPSQEIEKKVDEWVQKKEITETDYIPVSAIKESRFTLVIPEHLHMRIKKYCAVHRISMRKAITDLFEKNFHEN